MIPSKHIQIMLFDAFQVCVRIELVGAISSLSQVIALGTSPTYQLNSTWRKFIYCFRFVSCQLFFADLSVDHLGITQLKERSAIRSGLVPLRIALLTLDSEETWRVFGAASVNLWVMVEDSCNIIRQVGNMRKSILDVESHDALYTVSYVDIVLP